MKKEGFRTVFSVQTCCTYVTGTGTAKGSLNLSKPQTENPFVAECSFPSTILLCIASVLPLNSLSVDFVDLGGFCSLICVNPFDFWVFISEIKLQTHLGKPEKPTYKSYCGL